LRATQLDHRSPLSEMVACSLVSAARIRGFVVQIPGPGGRVVALCWPDQLVADAADGAQELVVLGAEFGAQSSYVHIDGAGPGRGVRAPDPLE
jgi:hypothetical protein